MCKLMYIIAIARMPLPLKHQNDEATQKRIAIKQNDHHRASIDQPASVQ